MRPEDKTGSVYEADGEQWELVNSFATPVYRVENVVTGEQRVVFSEGAFKFDDLKKIKDGRDVMDWDRTEGGGFIFKSIYKKNELQRNR